MSRKREGASHPEVQTLRWSTVEGMRTLQEMPVAHLLEDIAKLEQGAAVVQRESDRPFLERMLRRESARRTRLLDLFVLPLIEQRMYLRLRFHPTTLTRSVLAKLGLDDS